MQPNQANVKKANNSIIIETITTKPYLHFKCKKFTYYCLQKILQASIEHLFHPLNKK